MRHQKNRNDKRSRKSAEQKADLYGFHAVSHAWLNPVREVRTLYLTKQSHDGFASTLSEARKAGINRPEPIIVDKNTFDKMVHKGAVHQGVALCCDRLPDVFLSDLIIGAENRDVSRVLILDQVTDPHNVGAILRSACVFGAQAVIMQSKHAPDLGGVLAKIACGAVEHMDVIYETNLSRATESLQENGFFVYGLDERGEQTPSEVDIAPHAALVLGAEGAGLRRLVREHCDMLLQLPSKGALSSLNVSNAAAVALYALNTAAE